ncbi:MAG: hypothetical protein WA947_13070 [Phormidesmis sp.]
MSNYTLFEIASADEYRSKAGCAVLLAFRRFYGRSLKQLGQVGAGLLSLFLIVSFAAHSSPPASAMPNQTSPAQTPPAQTSPAQTSPAQNMSISMSMPHRLSTQRLGPASGSLLSPESRRASREPSTALSDQDKPFQMLRPKMTHHRLTTSRFSIPADSSSAVDNPFESE